MGHSVTTCPLTLSASGCRYGDTLRPGTSCGLRVNPQLSFVDDDRFDPCRKHSKLGVPLDDLVSTATADPGRSSEGLEGHSRPLELRLDRLRGAAGYWSVDLSRTSMRCSAAFEWVNLGGGYLFDDTTDLRPLHEAIDLLHSQYDLQVFVEPGAAFVRAAGYRRLFRSGPLSRVEARS